MISHWILGCLQLIIICVLYVETLKKNPTNDPNNVWRRPEIPVGQPGGISQNLGDKALKFEGGATTQGMLATYPLVN